MNDTRDQRFVLNIECGRHGGVFQRLAPGSYTLGSSADCDIVLSDPGIAAEHAKLSLGNLGLLGDLGLKGRLTVQPLNGDVAVGSRDFSPGQEIVSGLPVRLSLAGIEIRLEPTAQQERRKAWMEGIAASLLAAVAFAFGLNLFSAESEAPSAEIAATEDPAGRLPETFWKEAPAGAVPTKIVSSGLSQAGDGRAPVEAAEPLAEPGFERIRDIVAQIARRNGGRLEIERVSADVYRLTGYLPRREQLQGLVQEVKQEAAGLRRLETLVVTVEGAAEALRRQLATTGLDAAVRVTTGAGAVVASGEIKSDQAADWRAALKWFDRRFGRDLVFDANVRVTDGPSGPPLSIRAVWTGAAPYVIAGNGRKYVEGTLLDSGWTIEKIEREYIVLSRQGETLRLKL
ncbi:MAG: type III secretion system inner membrane ring subunit SctD [Kiloniellales bacterium]|nr:type III secretion system inner membrane ring subunit SctD [Kiloniellales bacterium]